MIKRALILAAGMGTRLRNGAKAPPKPLQHVAGLPLLTRTILTLRRAGVEQFYVVCGFMSEAVRVVAENDPFILASGARITCVENPDYHLANGVSVLAASNLINGPFLLSMSDHVYDLQLAELAAAADASRADLYLCVDRRVEEVYDIDDATKVRTAGDRIVDIGKEIVEYDAIDCGVFAVTPALFECLRDRYDQHGNCSLSDGVRELAGRGRARVLDIGGAFWQDVDTPAALRRAERILTRREERVQRRAG